MVIILFLFFIFSKEYPSKNDLVDINDYDPYFKRAYRYILEFNLCNVLVCHFQIRSQTHDLSYIFDLSSTLEG